MNIFFTLDSLSLISRLLIAHFVVDFVFQRKQWVEQKCDRKWKAPWLYIHGALAGTMAYLFAADWQAIWLIPATGVTHIVIDGVKSEFSDTIWPFIVDQVAHVSVLLASWVLLLNSAGSLISLLGLINAKFWIILLLYLIIIVPTATLVQKFIEPWQKELKSETAPSLQKAGLWIGRMERVLIVTFLLLGRLDAIGFLIAAKAVFRFSDTKNGTDRKETEYFLIGTLASFTVAVILGVGTQWLLSKI
jgi:hypothetical protein